MNITVLSKSFDPPPIDKTEVLRYAGCKAANDKVNETLNACIAEAEGLKYSVCYCKTALKISEDICDFGVFNIRSSALADNLSGCGSVVIFGATVGTHIDRLITKYGHISPSKALMLQALGTERIEALCDAFCLAFARENGAVSTPRFSPGYGDLPLEVQRQIFALLDCPKRIGLTLNQSLLMSPTKSVTAIFGIKTEDAL